jgi:hypothetical protein
VIAWQKGLCHGMVGADFEGVAGWMELASRFAILADARNGTELFSS